jgi:glycosyltransferase involved in cell wall biosynthesis
MLPCFMRYHDTFIDEFIIIDDDSADGSVEFLKDQAKVRFIKLNHKEVPCIKWAHIFFNQAWKES